MTVRAVLDAVEKAWAEVELAERGPFAVSQSASQKSYLARQLWDELRERLKKEAGDAST